MQLDFSKLARVQSACDAVGPMMDTPNFRTRFPTARLLRSVHEVETEAARARLPSTLLPFMAEDQARWADVYALDLEDRSEQRVVVWADHAVVAEWSTFDAFLVWVRDDQTVV